MKITEKTIESVISEVVGEDTLELVNFLKSNKNVSEFTISTKIKQPVDAIRNQLYRLYNNNLVSFIRKKDKKKGWYIYYWSLNLDRIKYLVIDLKRKRLEKLKERLLREETNHFFSCPSGCIRVDFEQATNFEYKCPECGSLLSQEDNYSKIEAIKKEISIYEEELKNLPSFSASEQQTNEKILETKEQKKINNKKSNNKKEAETFKKIDKNKKLKKRK